jgi:hypothetical protein
MIDSFLRNRFSTTLDHSTQALNPANLQIDYWRYFRSFPVETARQVAALVLGLKLFVVTNALYWGYGRWFVAQMLDAYSATYINSGLVDLETI